MIATQRRGAISAKLIPASIFDDFTEASFPAKLSDRRPARPLAAAFSTIRSERRRQTRVATKPGVRGHARTQGEGE